MDPLLSVLKTSLVRDPTCSATSTSHRCDVRAIDRTALTELAELRAVASVPEIGSQDRDGELLEAIAKSTADDDHVNFSEH
jgi:hypothetical protein